MKKKLLLIYKKSQLKTECRNRYPICNQNGGKMAKIGTQFMTKTAEKAYLYSPYKGVPSPRVKTAGQCPILDLCKRQHRP